MPLLLDRVNLVQVVLVVPVLVRGPQEADTLDVARLLVEGEHQKLVNRDVDPTLPVLNHSALKRRGWNRTGAYVLAPNDLVRDTNRRGPHVNTKRTTIHVEEPLLDIHGMPRRQLLPDNLALRLGVTR